MKSLTMNSSTALVLLVCLVASCYAVPSGGNDETQGRKYHVKPNYYNYMDSEKKAELMPQEKSFMSQMIQYIVKLFSPNGDSQEATRQLVSIMISFLDSMRTSFKARQAEARSNDKPIARADVAMAGSDLVKAYLKSLTEDQEVCIHKYICEANKQAVTDSNEVGYVIAQVGSYATSYLLEHFRQMAFDKNHVAAKQGRSGGNCAEIYNSCNKSLD